MEKAVGDAPRLIALVVVVGALALAPGPRRESWPPPTPDLPGLDYVERLPEAIRTVPPAYPGKARRAGITGTVMVQALVGTDGRVKDTRVIRSIPLLDRAAIRSVKRWTFEPARTADGRPVATWVAIPVRFALPSHVRPRKLGPVPT